MLIIQTNDGLSTANSYVSAAELSDYALQRGITLTRDLEQSLIRAMDYLESKQYKSELLNNAQSTLFPRMGVGIARPIKQAQLALATYYDGINPQPEQTTAQIKKEKVDVIEVEYFASEDNTQSSPLLTTVNELLSPYLAGASGLGLNVRVFRG